ncbi:MAG: transcription-repair coupling factor [Bacteroides sp.]|nr:transcription-repair coupling factor [Bacteroides sp.]
MTISEFRNLYSRHPSRAALLSSLSDNSVKTIYLRGLVASSAPLFTSLMASSMRGAVVFVLGDLEEAGYFYHDLMQLLGSDQILFFPSSYRRSVKYGQRDAVNEILRAEVLSRLQKENDSFFVVTYPDALAEKVISRNELEEKTIKLTVGDQVDIMFIAEVLRSYGFRPEDYVYEPGQYAIRGSIIDVFSFSSEYPYRIDFFGDEIDSIRTFEIESQLSREKREEIVIVPELGGSESAISFLDFLPVDTLLAVRDFPWIRERINSLYNETLAAHALVAAESEEQEKPLEPEKILIDGGIFASKALELRRIDFGNHPFGVPDATLDFEVTAQPIFHKNFDLVSQAFKELQEKEYSIYICSDSHKQIDRIRAIFEDRNDRVTFTAVDKTLHEGFTDHNLKIALFTDHQLFDRFHKYNLKSDKARSGKVALSLKELNQFTNGDYVVHTDHGIGRFGGLVRIPNGDTTQEVIKLIYQNEDVVFVSIHSLHKVSKYKCKEGEPPRLNKLGTGAWEKLKNRTKSRIKDIARDLIKLYSERRNQKGFAFSPDSFLQQELEASFIYEDTSDQLKTTQDVKADMERDMPMDRLVCGDVGFGKTEIAIRAAFKAVTDNKQVAVLVPTTVLAYQHYKTFTECLKDFPCRIEYLSRARTTAQTRAILQGLKNGEVDILIGTHKILGKEVQFKDLGLLVIDEEQKFGVSVKEKLRQIKVNVDTLTLTATPIPRTLQFSLIGARDLSVISTPPPNRYPIQTEIYTFSPDAIADAINFELSRNGQVFMVNNRIANLPELKAMIEREIPDVRVCTGHGQMEPAALEQVILDFVNHEYDVLIATTIIESGIDMPNVNTILVNDAQNYGLSTLHQLRGRVGRSNRKAFCYLLAPPLSSLTTEARRRLQAIENFSDLGSGIHIAMQDLDIRGAGNLLGAEQSGFIADLGYETYQKILTEAVQELKNDEFAELYADVNATGEEKFTGDEFVEETTIESDMELLLPANYVIGSSERMLLYRELDNLTLDREVEAFRTRLEDRFGPVPRETLELLRIVPLKRMAARLGVEKVFLKGGRMTLFFVSNPDSPYYQSEAFGKFIDFMGKYTSRSNLREQNGRRSMIIKDVENVETAVAILQEIMSLSGE